MVSKITSRERDSTNKLACAFGKSLQQQYNAAHQSVDIKMFVRYEQYFATKRIIEAKKY